MHVSPAPSSISVRPAVSPAATLSDCMSGLRLTVARAPGSQHSLGGDSSDLPDGIALTTSQPGPSCVTGTLPSMLGKPRVSHQGTETW